MIKESNYSIMNAITCTLVPINELDDASILTKMRVFGIFFPDEDKVMYGRGDSARYHYCISHVRSCFDEDSLATLDSEEAINDFTKKTIKIQYMKICSLAFLFGIGKDCVRDKYNNIIPIDLTTQVQNNILENNNGTYSPRLVSEITYAIYEHLDKLEDYEIITSEQKCDLINKYQEQLDHNDLILEEPEVSTCCCCGCPCNPCSQTCGGCPRNGRLLLMALETGQIKNSKNEDIKPSEPEVDIYQYNGEQVCLLKDVIKRYKDQFKGCFNPKKAVVKKNISHYIVSRHKKQWIPCADVKERKARILISVSWARANIFGFLQ